jgi:hypothetical protein
MIRMTTTRTRPARASAHAAPHMAAVLAAFIIATSFASEVRAQQDVAVLAITAPVSSCVPLGNENVTIHIFNYGPTLTAGTPFNVAYTVNGGAPVVELLTLASNLGSNSALDYTFTTQANLMVPGTYTFNATASLTGDVSPSNNAYVGYVVNNSIPSVGGTLAGPGAPSSSGTLTLSGSVGTIAQWEESDDGGLRWFALANESASQDYAGLRAPTQFRVRVLGAPCGPDVLSNVVTVSP